MIRSTLRAALVLGVALVSAVPAAAQSRGGPWFGVMLPPGHHPDQMQVLAERAAAPAVVPAGEASWAELGGASLAADLRTIVGFAVRSRETREIGDGMVWGRVTGLPSGAAPIEWAAEQFRAAGIQDVRVQRFEQDSGASLWLPLRWEVRLKANGAYGMGSQDVVLESAMPLSAGDIPAAGITAPVVYAGFATPAELDAIDVRGKIAVQKVIPQAHTVFTRGPAGAGATELFERGAVAVLNIVDLPGNMRVKDMGCGGELCFNLGGRDGHFLEGVLDAIADGDAPELTAHLSVTAERRGGLSAANAVAVVPGTTRPNEYVVVNAHADSWFDGAGDNGDGLAVMVAVARHFARPEMRQERSIVFVASAGHHSSGLSGPGHFVEMNPDIIQGSVLIINLEHTSQRNITVARANHPDGYPEWTMDSGEAPIVAGVSNRAPYVEGLVASGIQRYGTNFVSAPNTTASGEGGAYSRTGVPIFTTIQGPPMYHTTGEILEMVSTPGMERMARFASWFVKEVAKAPTADMGPRRER